MTLSRHHNSPCSYFPACGGCDFLDLDEQEYRQLKQQNFQKLLIEQKLRIAVKPDWVWVNPRSRRKIILHINRDKQLGFFAKKSHQIIPVEKCFAAEDEISAIIPAIQTMVKGHENGLFTQVSVTLFDSGLDLIFQATKELSLQQSQKLFDFAKASKINVSYRYSTSTSSVFINHKNQIFYPEFKLDLNSSIFLQATKLGFAAITAIIKNNINAVWSNSKRPVIADIYSGFGAYAFSIHNLANKIFAFEGDEKMVSLIKANANKNGLNDKIVAQQQDLSQNPISSKELKKFDLAIINPPRIGAAAQINEIANSDLKNLIYVSCNPVSFFSDLKVLLDRGFLVSGLTALDQFYGTRHLEVVAVLSRNTNVLS